MAFSDQDKISLATTFLTGLHKKVIRKALAAHHFTQKDLNRGAALLLKLMVVQAEDQENETLSDPTHSSLLLHLDAWENLWFPIIEVILEAYYPKIHAKVFKNLSMQQGDAVIGSVCTMLLRLQKLERGNQEDQKAFQHLQDRGLTEGERGKAQTLIVELLGLEKFPKDEKELAALLEEQPIDPQASLVQEDNGVREEEEDKIFNQSLSDLWNWYREWSTIARKVIKNKNHLISLGLRKRAAKSSKEDDTNTDDTNTDDTNTDDTSSNNTSSNNTSSNNTSSNDKDK